MESIYYVMTYLCHRQCVHCYEERFRPYYGGELERVAGESRANFRRIIENFPETMTFRDLAEGLREKRGRIILAGGEILLPAVRESVLYPALDQLYEKYRHRGGVYLVVQTTGDVLNAKILNELLAHHADVVSVSGIDDFHEGLETAAARQMLTDKLTAMFEDAGMTALPPAPAGPDALREGRRYYSFFGATPESWIGKLWPRGRAHLNGLSTASLVDNFCNAWSGGLNFLQYRHSGSEVSVEPGGNVYPCCIKTKAPLGNLLEEKLERILDRLTGNPMYEAISMGHPERMGIASGWSVEKFHEKSTITLPNGKTYQNVCIGCDAFHNEVLIPQQAVKAGTSQINVAKPGAVAEASPSGASENHLPRRIAPGS